MPPFSWRGSECEEESARTRLTAQPVFPKARLKFWMRDLSACTMCVVSDALGWAAGQLCLPWCLCPGAHERGQGGRRTPPALAPPFPPPAAAGSRGAHYFLSFHLFHSGCTQRHTPCLMSVLLCCEDPERAVMPTQARMVCLAPERSRACHLGPVFDWPGGGWRPLLYLL